MPSHHVEGKQASGSGNRAIDVVAEVTVSQNLRRETVTLLSSRKTAHGHVDSYWDKRPIADEFPHAGSFDELVGPVEGDGHSGTAAPDSRSAQPRLREPTSVHRTSRGMTSVHRTLRGIKETNAAACALVGHPNSLPMEQP